MVREGVCIGEGSVLVGKEGVCISAGGLYLREYMYWWQKRGSILMGEGGCLYWRGVRRVCT